MYADHRQPIAEDEPDTGSHARIPSLAPIGAGGGAAALVTSRYEGGRNRPLVLLILLAHVAALAALVKLDVVGRPAPRLLSFEVRPDSPPPPRAEPHRAVPAKQAPAPLAPPPIVATPTAPPPPVAAVAAPTLSTPPPAPVTAPAPPAPITPPDASAATLHNPAPRYPTESRRLREEGTVRLRVLISPAGDVEQVSVARSSGYDRLDKAALDAVRRWRFLPGMQAGQPVEAIGYLSIPFVLTR